MEEIENKEETQETPRKVHDRVREWMNKHAESKHSQFWLCFTAFFEAFILPVPPSTLMLTMIALGKKRRWVYFATITTIMSVLGGVFGYFIGYVLYDTVGLWIIDLYNLSEKMQTVGEQFSENAFLTIFLAAFTPIPYKVFTLGAGFFSINLLTFIVASIVGRGLRYYLVALFSKLFGEHVSKSIFKYMGLTVILSIVVLVVAIIWTSF
jgi:membrane protein YqaA with SNARE-associated domain